MSAKHTPTPWRVGRPGTVVSDSHIEHGPVGCDCVEYYGGHLIAESVTSANARRIAACVNACEGISTDAIETEGSAVMGWARAASKLLRLRSSHDELQELHQAIKEQRDELLAALKVAEESVGDSKSLEIVRAAIAKVEGTGA